MTYTLEQVLPHRPPMVLVDEITSFDRETSTLETVFTVKPGAPFHTAGGVPAWAAIEYMAQTAAALAGYADLAADPDRPARPGLLLGTRKMTLALDLFEDGRTYRVRAQNTFSDQEAAAFSCAILDDTGREVAAASLNAYRPPDFTGFLKEQGRG